MIDILEYLESKNIQYERQGNEAVLICPECHKPKLYVNTNSNLYQCWVCKAENPNSLYASGHFSKLQEEWGDIVPITPMSLPSYSKNTEERDFTNLVNMYHYNLENNRAAKIYLLNRGFTEDTIRAEKIGVTEIDGYTWISIPSREDGIPKLLKYRNTDPNASKDERFRREPNSKSIMFNQDILYDYDEVFICEGEFDALTLKQHGYENVVGPTGGASTLRPEWYELLYTKKKIYLVFDPDTAGQVQAEKTWATRLGIEKCWNVVLPDGEDVNSFFIKHTKDDFDKLIEDAKRFKVEGIISLGEAIHEIYKLSQEDSKAEFLLPWNNVNRLIGDVFGRKRLLVVGGPAGVGKTSLTLQIVHNFATTYEIPSLYFCLEMPETDLAMKIIQLEKDMVYNEVMKSDVLSYYNELRNIPIYFGYSANITAEIFYNSLREVRNRYGVGVAVFDNLQLLVRTGEESDIAQASKLFKNMAMDLNIAMILLSQPRKLNTENPNFTYDDLKGTSAISQDADLVMLMHRKRNVPLPGTPSDSDSSFSDVTSIIMDKARLASGGRTELKFIGDKSKFREFTQEEIEIRGAKKEN